VRIETQRFGSIEAPDDEIFFFPAGVPGFARLKRYVIVEHRPGSPFRWLQSADDPAVAFVVTDPLLVVDEYAPVLRPSDMQVVGARPGDELVLVVILTIAGEPVQVTANLKAPLIFNPRNRQAAQLVLEGTDKRGERYALRHAVPLSRVNAAERAAPPAIALPEIPQRAPALPRAAAGGAVAQP
jgi:flagellar assembly factor FliW